ncbi:MAG: hypothetical protein ACR2KS_01025 [Candidatus Eremiobacter antarcticus]|nr:hypothetical protein [Candidatus Eremiobacteraeota bacterium]MBC5808130.1 hypothetical protein [Candidatus Eremiobacteraeota bacterium]
MSGEPEQTPERPTPAFGTLLPMRDLAFSMLSLLIETAAGNLHSEAPPRDAAPDLREARCAIDAANALLASVKPILENEATLAIEGMLTQLQIEYVRSLSKTR